MIARTLAIAWTGFLQLVRSRVYLNIVVAGIGLVVAAGAFDQLSAGEAGRVLLDVGAAFISIVVAALSGVVAITAITRELETKQANLMLARPVGRTEFVIGRFLTTAMLVLLGNLCLGLVLSAMLAVVGAPSPALGVAICLYASLEGFIIAAVATFFGVGSSSTMSAVFTTTIFILGRLTGEMNHEIGRDTFGAATPILQGIYAVLPHLPVFDLTGLAHGVTISAATLATTALYGLAYAAAFLLAAAVRFARRDLL